MEDECGMAEVVLYEVGGAKDGAWQGWRLSRSGALSGNSIPHAPRATEDARTRDCILSFYNRPLALRINSSRD